MTVEDFHKSRSVRSVDVDLIECCGNPAFAGCEGNSEMSIFDLDQLESQRSGVHQFSSKNNHDRSSDVSS